MITADRAVDGDEVIAGLAFHDVATATRRPDGLVVARAQQE